MVAVVNKHDVNLRKVFTMKLTNALKKELITLMCVKEDAADDEFTKAAGEAFANGKLTAERYLELTADKKSEEANQFNAKLDKIADGLSQMAKAMADQKPAEKPEKEPKVEDTKVLETADAKTGMTKVIADQGGTPTEPEGEKAVQIRVMEAAEMYDDGGKSALVYPKVTKSGARHPLAGMPVTNFSSEDPRAVVSPSARDKAVVGAYAKLLCSIAQSRGSRTIGYQRLPQHDKDLLSYAMEKMEWSGASDGGDHADIKHRKLTSLEQKQLIDDAASGGLEAAPIVFDDQVISAPLLHGELFPLVNRIPVPRGRRVEGVAVGQVTGAWGGVDDTAVALFNTANYVSAFDTTIYRWEGAIRIGLDFLSDTPINFGQIVTQQYGEQLLEDLDDVIATGNGTTQPEGVINHAGVVTTAWGGATSIGNYESLLFGITKAELRPNVASSAVFCGTGTSYARAKALPVGATDARRLFGSGGMGTEGYRDYSLMGSPYKINESLTNAQIFYAVMARYRMYAREGLTIRTSTEGDTLIRRNELLMVAMARYGGQLERGACASITTTAPA